MSKKLAHLVRSPKLECQDKNKNSCACTTNTSYAYNLESQFRTAANIELRRHTNGYSWTIRAETPQEAARLDNELRMLFDNRNGYKEA